MKFAARAVSVTAASALLATLTGLSSMAQASETSVPPISSSSVQQMDAAPVPVAPQPATQAAVMTTVADTDDVPATALAEIQPDDTVVYPTLAAAVAAQETADLDDENLRCLAGAIYFESRGEPLAGQLAVAKVILNRAQSGRFGGSLCGVITQRGQFSFVRGGRVPSVSPNADYRLATAVAKVAMADAWDSDADEALYFHARRAAPGWSRTRIASIGNHVFYR